MYFIFFNERILAINFLKQVLLKFLLLYNYFKIRKRTVVYFKLPCGTLSHKAIQKHVNMIKHDCNVLYLVIINLPIETNPYMLLFLRTSPRTKIIGVIVLMSTPHGVFIRLKLSNETILELEFIDMVRPL